MDNDINVIKFIISQIDLCSNMIKGISKEKFVADIEKCYAVSMAVQVICENTNHISKETQEKYKDIEWTKISGLRNLISHDYGKLLFEDLYDTVVEDIPKLKDELLKIKL